MPEQPIADRPTPPPAGPGGVIHDLGYRGYDGPRESDATIGWTLLRLAYRNLWGFGRTGRSKALPFTLLVFNLVPAIVMVGTLALTQTDLLISSPISYLNSTQLLASVFVAVQTPVLFTNDLRTRTIVLYLARPLSSRHFVLARWGALVAGVATFLTLPLVVLVVGSFFGEGDGAGYLSDSLRALPLVALLTLLLASIAALISSVALRRGVAVISTVILLVVVTGMIEIVQAVSQENGLSDVGAWAGLASPWTLVLGLGDSFDLADTTVTPPEGAMIGVYVALALIVVTMLVLALVRRFAKAGR